MMDSTKLSDAIKSKEHELKFQLGREKNAEKEADKYFMPKDAWTLLLQCLFIGKARDVCKQEHDVDVGDYHTA